MSDVNESNQVCPNCNTPLKGEYCYECGQPRIHHPETVGHFVRHFFDDITHFDSKFFKSLKPLLFKPGFLTNEFNAGRRASYLHPIRAYLFLSFVYFFLLLSCGKNKTELVQFRQGGAAQKNLSFTSSWLTSLSDSLEGENPELKPLIDSLKNNREGLQHLRDSLEKEDINAALDIFLYWGTHYRADTMTYEKYVNAEAARKEDDRDGWILSGVFKKQLLVKEKFHNNFYDFKEALTESFIHNIPKMLFFLLPVFALILKLLYVRRRIVYVNHAIFSLHYFSFLFMLYTLGFLARKIYDTRIYGVIVFFILIYYLYKAMKNVYHQSRFKTFFKFVVLVFTFLFIFSITSVINILISFLTLA